MKQLILLIGLICWQTLLHAETGYDLWLWYKPVKYKTFKYRIQKVVHVNKGVLFVAMGFDGITIDEKGNVYLTGNSVTVLNQ